MVRITEDEELLAFVVAITVLFSAGGYRYRKELMTFIKDVFEKDRRLGTLLYLGMTTLGTVLLSPITPFNILAVLVYTPFNAFLISLLGHVLGASLAFFISREYAPHFIKNKLDDLKVFKLLSKKSNLSTKEWTELVALTRVSPNFPYAPISYLWGFTEVPFTDFLVGTTIGTIPYLVLELYLIYQAGDVLTGKYNYHVVIGIVVTIFVTYLLDRYVRKLLKEKGT